ncbi:MAG: hypothetical protein LBF69_03780 [Prevotellaceae bacterium]|nr:hypothetical protein [Prevotellaceae bacterium]
MQKSSTHRQDWWSTLSAEEQASIERGLADAANGKTALHSEVKKRYDHLIYIKSNKYLHK